MDSLFETNFWSYEKFTFKSVILPLTLVDIERIHNAHTSFLTGGDPEEELDTVEAKVDAAISLLHMRTGNECRVTLRLSSSSLWDAIPRLNNFHHHYQEKLAEEDDDRDVYSHMKAIQTASLEAMVISQGKEAVELLRRSDRIQKDLSFCLKSQEPMNLIIREFVCHQPKNRWRAFVRNGVLLSITRYKHLNFFAQQDDMVEEKEKLQELMDHFISAVNFHLKSCVVDLIIDDDGKVWVVEVKPFQRSGGPLPPHIQHGPGRSQGNTATIEMELPPSPALSRKSYSEDVPESVWVINQEAIASKDSLEDAVDNEDMFSLPLTIRVEGDELANQSYSNDNCEDTQEHRETKSQCAEGTQGRGEELEDSQ